MPTPISRLFTVGALAALAAFCLLAGIIPAHAQSGGERKWLETAAPKSAMGKRVALVVGNSHYTDVEILKSPENDARAMADTLQALGFDVLLCLDRTDKQMYDDLREFRTNAASANVALFYFSGHGVQISGENYLIPVNWAGVDLHNESVAKSDAVGVGAVLETLRYAKAHVNIVVIDTCRNSLPEGTNSRGLAPIDAPNGTLICYATAPGKTASENQGRTNGLYTQELLKQMKTPGLPVEDVFVNTRKAVRLASGGKQVPWEESSLEDPFYFVEPTVVAASTAIDTAAHLKVTVNVPNATVHIDGRLVDPGSEATIDLGLEKSKIIEIYAEAPGYVPRRITFPITAGAHVSAPVSLTEVPTRALDLSSINWLDIKHDVAVGPHPLYTGSYAIIVGISRYRNSSKNLTYADADATALRDLLVAHYDFPADHITLLLNEKATKANIEKALSGLADGSKIKEGDRILVFFSGHGQTVKIRDGDMGFLIPTDADVDLAHPENRSGYLSSCLRMDTIWGYLSASSARHALLIADACYGGLLIDSKTFAPERPSAPVLANLLARPALQALTAGGAGETVIEDPTWGHGALTFKLLEELRAQAATPGSLFLASQLASALKTSVGNITGGRQTPQFGSHGFTEGDFVFYTTSAAPLPPR